MANAIGVNGKQTWVKIFFCELTTPLFITFGSHIFSRLKEILSRRKIKTTYQFSIKSISITSNSVIIEG